MDITADGLMVNNALVVEPRVIGETTQIEGGESFPLQVPKGKVFVLGEIVSIRRIAVFSAVWIPTTFTDA